MSLRIPWLLTASLIIVLVVLAIPVRPSLAQNQLSLRVSSTVLASLSALDQPSQPVQQRTLVLVGEANRNIDLEATRYLLGVHAYYAGHYQEAVDFLEPLRTLESGRRYGALQYLGYAYRRMDRIDSAVETWDASGYLEPAYVWGDELRLNRNLAQARDVMQALLRTENADQVRALSLYASYWAMESNWSEALPLLRQAHGMNPHHIGVLIDLGRAVYYVAGDLAQTDQFMQRAMEEAQDDPRVSEDWVTAVIREFYRVTGETPSAAILQQNQK